MMPICFETPTKVRGKVKGRAVRALRVVWRERRSDRTPLPTPIEVFRILAAQGQGKAPAFLNSGEGFGAAGRYSMLALELAKEPSQRLCVGQETSGDPFSRLREALGRWAWRGEDRPPIPFLGGWLGYFSYDLAHHVERFSRAATVDHGFPLIELMFCPRVVTYDHLERTWFASQLLQAENEASASAVERELDALLDRVLTGPIPNLAPEANPNESLIAGPLSSNFTQSEYEQAVARVLEYIAAGDVYQVNLSQRFTGKLCVQPDELATRLFEVSPAPFSAYIPFGERTLISSSPERFLQVKNHTVETWPIKGTQPRGATAEEDARLRAELISSPKERAELVMITDLMRSDLGRVCEYGSVEVAELRAVESYPSVHHAYSRVRGRLRPQVGTAELLRAVFPGGSITGAPKLRAMEIIEELEPTARGPYCGAIGYLGVDGAMDLNIAIRTILCEGGRLTFQVGSGIVADSRPDREYQETLHKARGIMKALGVEGVKR